MIDAFAGERHFLSHIAPVWNKLGRLRGQLFVPGEPMARYARSLGLEPYIAGPVWESKTPVLVASWGDYKKVGNRPVIFMEHGCGLSYGGDHSSYAGGPGKENVILFLNPNDRTAEMNRRSYPGVPNEVVGCPKLDTVKQRGVEGRTVAVSFHWPCHVVPETTWAYPEYRNFLRRLGERTDAKILGHAHPRVWDRMQSLYQRIGIEPVKEFTEVLERADLYVIDNSSTLYEFAAAGRPTVAMNSIRYRKDVHHGLRFWEGIPGPQVDHGEQLAPTIRGLLDGGWTDWEDARLAAVQMAYSAVDGKSTRRAIEAIRRVL